MYQRYSARASLPLALRREVPEALVLVGEREAVPGDPPVDPEHRALEREIVDAAKTANRSPTSLRMSVIRRVSPSSP